VFTAINRGTGVFPRLRDYRVHSTTGDASSQAEVILELEDEQEDKGVMVYQGRALSQDTIFASAKAYINAINQICKERSLSQATPAKSPQATAAAQGSEATTHDVEDRGRDDLILQFPSIRRDRA
jgi:LeuA allosteric (dimerisation) domain